MALAACQPSLGPFSSGDEDISPDQPETSVDRITYVNSAGDIFTINADGSEQRRLTGGTQVRSGTTGPFVAQGVDFETAYTWPTWSPDGAKLAASRVQVSGNQDAEVTVQVLDPGSGRSQTVFSNDFPGLVADGSPHYLYWSPDGQHLSFLASTQEGLALYIVNTLSSDEPIVVERGGPLYYSWSGDGNSLLVHVGEEVKLYRELSDHAAGELLAEARGFRAPAFSPEGKRLAYTAQAESGQAVFVAELGDLENAKPVLEVGAFAAFIWSPDGSELAVVDQQGPGSAVFERLRAVSLDENPAGPSVRTIAQEPLLAFYWSPNGQRIAWVAVNQEDRTFQLKVAPNSQSGAGEERSLFTFNPTRDLLTMLSFFDQYTYSHSLWSPDSTRLVVAGGQEVPFERRNGHTPTGARVFVIDAVGDTPPQEIAEGSLAFWSWN